MDCGRDAAIFEGGHMECHGVTLQAFLACHLGIVWPCLAVALVLSQQVACVASQGIPIIIALDRVPLHC